MYTFTLFNFIINYFLIVTSRCRTTRFTCEKPLATWTHFLCAETLKECNIESILTLEMMWLVKFRFISLYEGISTVTPGVCAITVARQLLRLDLKNGCSCSACVEMLRLHNIMLVMFLTLTVCIITLCWYQKLDKSWYSHYGFLWSWILQSHNLAQR